MPQVHKVLTTKFEMYFIEKNFFHILVYFGYCLNSMVRSYTDFFGMNPIGFYRIKTVSQ